MNIEEVKEARDEFIKVNEHILELANKQFSGLTLQARIKHEAFMLGVDGLIAKLEQAEKALINIRDNTVNYSYVNIANEALIAIRGNQRVVSKVHGKSINSGEESGWIERQMKNSPPPNK